MAIIVARIEKHALRELPQIVHALHAARLVARAFQGGREEGGEDRDDRDDDQELDERERVPRTRGRAEGADELSGDLAGHVRPINERDGEAIANRDLLMETVVPVCLARLAFAIVSGALMKTVLFLGCAAMLMASGLSAPAQESASGRNLLWDAGFDTGFGNGFWTTVNGNVGPSRRDMWSGEVLTLKLNVGSRIYSLAEGDYALCAWVRRAPGATEADPTVTLELTNGNYYRDKLKNSYEKKFPVAPGDAWQRVGWIFTVSGAIRPLYHVEIRGSAGVMVDVVSLTAGAALPETPSFAADAESGFDVGEETRVYLDGEPRTVDLMIANHGPAKKVRVKWAVYDFREDLVREGVVEEEFPAATVTRRRLPLEGLPHGGYRLASSVEGSPVLGDALVAFLPKVDARAFPWIGVDACFQKGAIPFTPRMFNRLGFREANLLSCSANFARWGIVEAEKGQYAWQDFMADAGVQAGIEMIPYVSMTYGLAPWMRALLGDQDKRYTGFSVADEKGFSEAYCRYVDAYVRHYAPKGVRWFMIEDEVHSKFPPSHMDQFVRLYVAAYDTAKKAGAAVGVPVLVGINASTPDWWDAFLAKVPHDKVDMLSSNTAHRPAAAAEALNVARKRGFATEIYHTAGVGQKSPKRQTSLIADHGDGTGFAVGIFAWQAMLHAWLSRPYGTENPKDGPLAHIGFYDGRTLAQCAYLPFAGKTGVEFDNSPSVGWQSLTILKSQMPGMRPVRDPAQPFSVRGLATGSPDLFVYPFRDATKALLVVAPAEEGLLDRACRLTGADFKAFAPADLYGNRIATEADGVLAVREFPIYLHATAAGLPNALAALRKIEAKPVARAERYRIEAGDYALEVDLAREGYLRLWRGQGEHRALLLDRFAIHPALKKPREVKVAPGRIASSMALVFDKACALTLNVSAEGCELSWAWRNTLREEVRHQVRFRVGSGGAGRRIVIQEGAAVRAGKLREDYGALALDPTPPAPEQLAPNSARIVLADFLRGDLPAASGRGFSPATGLLWKTEEGQAFLEANYTLKPYAGGGSQGAQLIVLKAFLK